MASLTDVAQRRTIAALFTAIALSCASGSASARPTEWDVKAAFLPRFARYVTWPAAAMPKGDAPFVLCVIGTDPFGPLLDDAARSQTVDGRRIIVRRLDATSAADGCHIAFIAGNRTQSVAAIMAGLGHRPVLAVTDAGNGGAHSMVQFTIIDGRVRFSIDQSAARQRGLTISSRLLALAVGVRP